MRLEGDPGWLEQQARRCRRLAASTTDEATAKTLTLMAAEYEREAVRAATTIVEQIPGAGDGPNEKPQPPLIN